MVISFSLVGGDDWGPMLSTGVSASIRGDTLTLTPKGDRALLAKEPYQEDLLWSSDGKGRTIINSARELAGGKLSFRLTESTVYFMEVESSADMVDVFRVIGREEFEKERSAWRGDAGTLGRYDAVVVDAQGNVVSLRLWGW